MFWKAWSNFEFTIMSRRTKEEKIFVNNYIPLPPDDFYTKSKLQDALSRPSQYFTNAEIKNFHKNGPKILTGKGQTIWLHLQVELKETICFLRKVLIVSLLKKKKKNPHIFVSAIKKTFYYKKMEITTTDNTKLNF